MAGKIIDRPELRGGATVNGTEVIDENGDFVADINGVDLTTTGDTQLGNGGGDTLGINTTSVQLDADQPITDANGNELLGFQKVASAVNYVAVVNAATGDEVEVAAVGSDPNVSLKLSVQGSGDLLFGGPIVHDSISSSSGAAAVPVATRIHEVTTTGTGDALTLANGNDGQRLTILYVAEGAGADTAVLTPTTLAGGTTITFNNLGDSAELVYSSTGGWYVVGLGGAAAVA